ncbi:transporter substrate-binding domain-containing protein [Thiorhodococcus minor]|uniref:histidine kinase n=1 Tax=Thiorhodococcus minor TaxID=57489 RepID=A0A6M0K7J2_9GAMM|nr:transporter substrate-binding domain-containing protein [Thiorhodococcus minor]NEV64617.1 transporter substrate-binding domain-containing protein [Thiorhodococcus minor]
MTKEPDDLYRTSLLRILLMLACWLPALQAAAEPGVELTQAERDWLAANPRILLGSDAQWRPFVWRRDDGTQAGIETDLVARINALTGANIQLMLGDWSDMVERARRGELHGLAASASHPERADRFLFSTSPYRTYKFIFTRRSSAIASMDDLSGRRVGVLRANLSDMKLLANWPAIVPVEIDSPLALAVAVQNAEVDAAISSANLEWIATESMLPDLRLAFPVPGSKLELRYSILKEQAPLLGIIDKALKAIDPVVMMKILRKWGTEEHPNIALSADERAWLAEKHSVRVRIGEHPPWEINGSKAEGMAVDYLRIIGKLFDIDFRFVPAADSWTEGFEDMAGAHRRYDLLPAAKRTDARLATLAMSQDYLSSPWTMFTRKGSQDIQDLSDLRGRTVAVERGYVMHDLLQSAEPATVLSVQESTRDALLSVSTGRADAYIGNLLVTDYLMQTHGIANLRMAGPTPFGAHKQAMVTRKEWAPLISLIDKGLDAITAEQHIAIRQRWLSSVASGMQAPMELSDEERAYLDATSFRRAFASAWMPFDFADSEGAPTGVAEDYWTLIRDKLGLRETNGERQPFGDILAAMERGDIDLYAATTRTADRERYALFSTPYERYPIAIAGAANAGLFAGTASLQGRRVAVGMDYSAYHLLKARSPGIDFVLVDNTRAALEAVAAGSAEAAVDILPVLHQQIENFPPGRVKLVGVTDVEFPLQLMVSRRNAALLPLINRAIAAITPEERAAIHNKWLLRQVVTAPDYSLLWQVLATGLLILATILYWNRRLHLEVGRRKQAEAELQRAKDMADRASRAKGDFLANMSHEIRTPLNAVIGLTHLSLQSDPAPPLRAYLGKIDLSARTLLALINDVLDLSRIEADKLHPRQEPMELDEVLAQVQAMVEQQAADKGLELRIEGPTEPVGTLLGDGLRLTQVLLNLVGNAIKFTPQGAVTLAVSVEDESAQALRLAFRVTDTGIGIPEDRRADLFEAFTQLDMASTRSHGGSGLGLTISARLVALMGGRLEMESVEGAGSCFWLSLAFSRATEAAKEVAAPVIAPEALRGIRVLMAEDDPVNQLLVRDLLSRRGAEVTLVATGAEAVTAAAEGSFDMVLMDIRMPEMDGLEASRRIRALPDGGPPIVALTANALAGERERCLAVGMDGYLTKPLEPETLYAELYRQLRLPAGERAATQPASTAAQPALPGFDAAKVRRWLNEAPDAWRSMVRVFVAEYPPAATAIGAALEAGDRTRAGDLLHRLRGAAGALGAEDLTTAAERLEQALARECPVDIELRTRFFSSAEASLAVLAQLEIPREQAAPAWSIDPDGAGRGQPMRELESLLEVGNTRALDHLPWLERWIDAEAPEEGGELLRQMDALDFPAALETLRRLEKGARATPR